MVVFTCQHCGSTVNKNKVEKHYSFECRRNSPFVTCVDCLKDFRGEEYVAHTQCLTEEERYAPKGFMAKTPSSVKKRASWLSSVEASLNTPGLTQIQKRFIESLLSCSNVPQKRKKFQNFVKSAFGRQCPTFDVVNSVFDILEKTHKRCVEEESQNGNSNKQKEVNDNLVNNNGNNDCGSRNNGNISNNENDVEVEEGTEELNKKFTKKNKNNKNWSKSESNGVENAVDAHHLTGDIENNRHKYDEENTNGNLQNEERTKQLNSKASKKNKKNRSKSESSDLEISSVVNVQNFEESNDNIENENNSEGNNVVENNLQCDKKLSRKEKKEKKKREKYEAELNEIENNKNHEEEIDNDITKENKKNKKGKKKNFVENGAESEVNVINEKKKNKRSNDEEEIDEPLKKKPKATDSEIRLNESIESNHHSGVTFNWSEMIVKVLELRSDKEISVNRLCKKVINEYHAVFGENHMTYEKLVSKFNKKLHKTPGVKVLKDKAKLKT